MEAIRQQPRKGRRAYLILGAVATVAALAWLGHRWWSAGKQTTDDAQVEADIVPISARVGGVVATTFVRDDQAVKKGDPLFELDPAELDVEVARTTAERDAARAQQAAADAQVAIVEQSTPGVLSSAKAALTGATASARGAADTIRASEASVARATADLATAEADLARARQLFATQAITRRELEQAEQVRAVAKAGHDAASAQLDAAREQRGMAQARIAEAQGRVTQSGPVDQHVAAARAAATLAARRVEVAEVALRRAVLDRSYARVVAPFDGRISKLGAHAGQAIHANQAVLMLVPNETFVVANFKEGQIAAMKAGDPVDIAIDAYEGTYHGVIEAISPATGARFSLLPPDNATGNFVKVVQRVPVKIAWRAPPSEVMRPGLSAVVTVHVAH